MSNKELGNSDQWGGWARITLDTGKVHVVPRYDLGDEHVLNEECSCGTDVNEQGFITHNAFDGREEYETGLRRAH